MEHKFNKQLWLESVLKKLYRKVDSLEAVDKPRNYQKRKLNVPTLKVEDRKREEEREEDKEDIDPETITPSKKQKRQPKTEHNEEKFWNFVDEFVQSKPFHARSKNGFFNTVKIPSTINYTLWKSIGFIKTEISPLDEEKGLEEKIFLKIQKVRMKKATDIISKEVLEERERIVKKTKKY